MKKMLLLFFILLLTGCSTEVRIVIDEENVSETINIFGLKSEIYQNETLNEDIKTNIEVFEREYEFYDVDEFENKNNVGKTYKLSESLELWAELTHLRPCYEKFQLSKTSTNISLETSEEYRCGYLFGANDVILIIESDLELVSSNADRVEDNKLIWNINDDNYQNKSINFNFKTTKKKSNVVTYIIYLTIACLVICVTLFVRKKNNENNKI